MRFLEKDLEDIIWESDNELLKQKGLEIEGKKYRQLKIGNFGVSDLITVKRKNDLCYNYLDISIYELKKEKVGISAFLQAIRYCKGIKTYLDENKPNINYRINIVLISKEVDLLGSFIFLPDLFYNEYADNTISSINFYSFKYDINGILFKKEEDYNLIDKGF
jgi:hypothetical protein